MGASRIEWTDETWNPTTGCDRVSPGCDHCYAMSLAPRLKAMGAKKYQRDGDPETSGPGFGVSIHEGALQQPLAWKKPRRVFVNSMSDLFHAEIPDDFIARVFAVMALTPQHTYQVLTKRHARMRSLLNSDTFMVLLDEAITRMGHAGWLSDVLEWPFPNVWLGASVENQQWADIRIPALLATPAAVRFLSAEPLLGPIDLRFLDYYDNSDCKGCSGILSPAHVPQCGVDQGVHWGIDWVIVGGESGPHHRPIEAEWVLSLRDQCSVSSTAFFFKQWGGFRPKSNGRELDGVTYSEFPEMSTQ